MSPRPGCPQGKAGNGGIRDLGGAGANVVTVMKSIAADGDRLSGDPFFEIFQAVGIFPHHHELTPDIGVGGNMSDLKLRIAPLLELFHPAKGPVLKLLEESPLCARERGTTHSRRPDLESRSSFHLAPAYRGAGGETWTRSGQSAHRSRR